MAIITKTEGTVILTHQAITHPASAVGTELDVDGMLAATLVLYHGFVEAAANTNPGTFFVFTSPSAAGNEDWAVIAKFTAAAVTPDDETLSGAEAQGQTVLGVAATAGFAAEDVLYIQDTGVVADGEWNRCEQIVANVSIDIIWGLANAKDNADIIYNDAEIFVCQVDCTAVTRILVVFQHEGAAGANVHVKGIAVTGDSIG